MSKTSNELVAKKLKAVREQKDLSQERVADYLGISQQAYSKYELGATRLSTDKLLMFCELAEIPVNDFLPLYKRKEVQSA